MEKVSHSTELYTLGKGILMFDRFDDDGLPTGLRDLGNAPSMNLTVEIEKIEHISSREGISTVDWTRTKIRRLKGSFELEEFDRDNLRLWLFGKTGTFSIAPFTSGDLLGALDFWPMNDAGPRYHYEGWKVKLSPTGNLGMISDDVNRFGFEFETESDAANHPESPYGKLTLIGES
jgi:hypothetical protein